MIDSLADARNDALAVKVATKMGEAALAPGAIIADRYRIEALLGEGGMGVVYLAEHVHLRKRVALKVLLPEWSRNAAVLARFEREAIAGGSITHPNVAASTDFGRLPEGSFFLVLEYVAGKTLRTVLEAGALTPERALKIVRGIALAIGAAHAQGVVHRDLKPENVMLITRDENHDFVKVLDFGIAKIDMDDLKTGLTTAGMIIGTPDYMAPEQALGGTIDHRADLYAVGVILFELLTGRCPFQGGAATVLRQHVINDAPILPSDLGFDPRVNAIVARLLDKSPAARFASASELVAAIDACGLSETIAPNSRSIVIDVPARTKAIAALRQRPTWIAAAAVAIVAIAIAGLFAMRSEARPDAAILAPPVMAAPTRNHDLPPPLASAASAASAPSDEPSPSASAQPRPATSMTPPPGSSGGASKGKRKTGPGGIYVPPPSQWFR